MCFDRASVCSPWRFGVRVFVPSLCVVIVVLATRPPGKSDQTAISGIITDFLHSPFDSVSEPLDLLFVGQTPGARVKLFSVGVSIGSGRIMSALSILYAVAYPHDESSKLSEEEFLSIGKELMALMSMKATCQPEPDIIAQVGKSISKKCRMAERTRPNAIQLHTAFSRVLRHKRSTGDKRPELTILGEIIKQYNQKQPAKAKVTSDERDALLMLHEQLAQFRQALSEHWLNFPVASSGVPVSYLALPWLRESYEPPIKKAENPRHHAFNTSSKGKIFCG